MGLIILYSSLAEFETFSFKLTNSQFTLPTTLNYPVYFYVEINPIGQFDLLEVYSDCYID